MFATLLMMSCACKEATQVMFTHYSVQEEAEVKCLPALERRGVKRRGTGKKKKRTRLEHEELDLRLLDWKSV